MAILDLITMIGRNLWFSRFSVYKSIRGQSIEVYCDFGVILDKRTLVVRDIGLKHSHGSMTRLFDPVGGSDGQCWYSRNPLGCESSEHCQHMPNVRPMLAGHEPMNAKVNSL